MRLRISRLWKQIQRKLGRWRKHAKGLASSCRAPKVTDGFSDFVVNGVANLPPSKARSADSLGRHLSRSGTADDLTLRAMASRPEKDAKLHIEGDGESEMDEEWMLEMLRAGEQQTNQMRWRDGGTIQRYGSAVDMRQLLAGDSSESYTAKQRMGTVVPLGTLNGTPWERDTRCGTLNGTPARQHQGSAATLASKQRCGTTDGGPGMGGNGTGRLGYHRSCRSGSVPAAMDVMSVPLRPPPGRRRPTAPK
ncbi:hypothetical protein CLOM_g4259 [Closterium sp. NIES-68]|nr:hypothetical protein CLOM_g4259 [Closterium sp. NIES-68]GJP80137.1 hypothetical protein CLOP_g10363 [Closterium sp. NIES-67]